MNPIEQMSTETTSKTPSQDAQGHWYALLSPTQVLTGEEKSDGNKDQPDTAAAKTTATTNRKKKCRGNRKAQRQRRKLRRKEAKKKKNEQINPMEQDIPNTDGEQQMQVSF